MYNNYRYFVVFNTIYTTIVTIFGYSGKVIIPAEINGHKVTKICDGAFRDSQISLIEFEASDNIESIGMGAFYNCSLEKIDIPNVKYIFTNTFENCTNLSEVSIPKSVIKINKFAFKNCGLINIVIPEGIERIDNYAFSSCPYLKSVTISEGVKEIGWAAFEKATLETVNIPSSVKRIETYAFNECRELKNVTISEGVNEIGYSAFAATALETVYIPSSVKSIEEYAFYECRELKDVTISEGVEHIGMLAFNNCQNIGDVQIPASVKKIEAYAFNKCWFTKIGTFTFNRKSDFEYDYYMFLNCNNVTIYVLESAKNNYIDNDGNNSIFYDIKTERIKTF